MSQLREQLLAFEAEHAVRIYPAARPLELRAADDGSDELILDGVASVTNYWYEMFGGPPYGWEEMVVGGAFRKTLSESPDVVLRVNHTGTPLARTKSGTLDLDENDQGLHDVARLDPRHSRVADLRIEMERGDLDEQSMAFRIARQRWEDEDGNEADPMTAPRRKILEIILHRGDVGPVTFGANDATFVGVRAAETALVELRAGRRIEMSQYQALRKIIDGMQPVAEPEPEPAGQHGTKSLGRVRAADLDLAITRR